MRIRTRIRNFREKIRVGPSSVTVTFDCEFEFVCVPLYKNNYDVRFIIDVTSYLYAATRIFDRKNHGAILIID